MKRINLRNYYPFYTSDCFIEVSDEVAAVLQNYKLYEAAYRMRTYRHRAFYSLDRDDGIQRNVLVPGHAPRRALRAQSDFGTALCRACLAAGQAGKTHLRLLLFGPEQGCDCQIGRGKSKSDQSLH